MQEVEPVLLLRFRKSLFNLGHSLFTQTSLGVGKLLGSLFKILPNRGRTYGADCNTFIDGEPEGQRKGHGTDGSFMGMSRCFNDGSMIWQSSVQLHWLYHETGSIRKLALCQLALYDPIH